MLIKSSASLSSSEITPKALWLDRRRFLEITAGAAIATAAGLVPTPAAAQTGRKLPGVTKGPFSTSEAQTRYKDVTGYNNFYEFGSGKDDPAKNAGSFRTRPWTLAVEGEVAKPATWHLEDFIKPYALQERVYRHRCVERWSMVVPWVGIPLGDIIRRLQPTPRAKFVEFTTLFDPSQFPEQRGTLLPWPYTEGLRLDEAMHPLTMFVVGLYGEVLPNQNGAPLRLVVPWKYGFKGAKSIVKMRFTEQQPVNTWQRASSREYGFYANVNPAVDHPRWSQARERRIGEWFMRPTLPFNGYADQVASMYSGMDLRKNF